MTSNSQRMSLPNENKMAAIHVIQSHMHARFPRSKKMADLYVQWAIFWQERPKSVIAYYQQLVAYYVTS